MSWSWILFYAVVVLSIAAAWIVSRKWIAPWRQIEDLARQIERGEQPRTFLVDAGPEPKRVGLVLEKILGRQQELERQITESESGTRTILRAMQDGLLVVDADRRVTLVNRAFRELFGLQRILPGTPLLDCLRNPTLERLISEALRTGIAANTEMIAPDSTGERQLELSAVPMKDDVDRTTGAVILFHDITQLKKADNVRRDLVANVSHELRTPLSILRGYIETLRDSPQTSRDERARILEVMERHSKRLGLIVQDLLILAELESTTPKLQLSNIKIDNLMLSVARDWEKKFAQKNLKATVDLAAGLPMIQGDETRIEEVLHNLLDNALKYSPEGGEIRLRAEVQPVAGIGDPGREELVISVSDKGVGISKEDLPRIFERFYRADKARGGEPGGTGLGLAIVKHIAQLHGGRVEAASEPEKGTIVRVLIPAVTQT